MQGHRASVRVAVLAALFAGLLLAHAGTSAARAHEPVEAGTMFVEFVDPGAELLELVWEFFDGALSVFADGERCVTLHAGDPGWTDYGDHVATTIVVGRDGQPEACRREGAFLTFGDGASRWLITSAVLKFDTTFIVDNCSPPPPHLAGPPIPPAAGHGAVVPASPSPSLAIAALLLATIALLAASRALATPRR